MKRFTDGFGIGYSETSMKNFFKRPSNIENRINYKLSKEQKRIFDEICRAYMNKYYADLDYYDVKYRLEQVCDKCCAPLNGNKYLPLKSKEVNGGVNAVNVASRSHFYTVEYDSRPHGNMSCDADRSSIRYKSLVSSDYFKAISLATSSFDQDGHISFLDVGSNRGAFYTLISNKFKIQIFYVLSLIEVL